MNHLSELARFAREEKDFWHALVEDFCFEPIGPRGRNGAFTIQIGDLMSPISLGTSASASPEGLAPTCSPSQQALTGRLVRRLYQGVRGDCRDLTAVHVQQVIHLASDAMSGSRIELPGGILVERHFNELFQFRRNRCRSSVA